MSGFSIVGLQWGDEGKGKIVDFLSRDADWVVRFQGGANAGHTIVVNNDKVVLHQVPAGILMKKPKCVIAHGVVLDPLALVEEIEALLARKVEVAGRLFISERCHVVMPYHKLMDAGYENQSSRIGTTQRGIGPCYADKMARKGFRLCDVLAGSFKSRLADMVEEKNKILKALFGADGVVVQDVFDKYSRASEYLKPFVCNTIELLNDATQKNEKMIFEAAQGSLLDVDVGTYPYVTSSNSDVLGIAAGCGIPPTSLGHSIGICKAYCTRVGEGPFPTELKDDTGEKIRQRGKEYGATTGRPRRCGWFDAAAVRYSLKFNGIAEIGLTKIDVLSGLKEIKVCTSYGNCKSIFPASADDLDAAQPVYESFSGWDESIQGVSSLDGLPENARRYIRALEVMLGTRIGMVSTGSDRDEVIVIKQ